METKNPETQKTQLTQIEDSQKNSESENSQGKNFTQRDIFDKIMSLPFLRIFEPFYKKYKMALLYLFFGGLAFFLNFFLFVAIDSFTPIGVFANNAICWVVCVLFQFFTNRTWVFDGSVNSAAGLAKQMAAFFAGRLFTLFSELAILAIFITWLSLPKIPVKLFAQIVVIILNYVISKLLVFRKK